MAPKIAPTARQANAIPTAPPVVNTIKNYKREIMLVKCKRDELQGAKACFACSVLVSKQLYFTESLRNGIKMKKTPKKTHFSLPLHHKNYICMCFND